MGWSHNNFDENHSALSRIALIYLEKNEVVSSTECSAGCLIPWNTGYVRKTCAEGAGPWTFTFPHPGRYEVVATYKDGAERRVGFRIKDPCESVSIGQNLRSQQRVPASLPKAKKTK